MYVIGITGGTASGKTTFVNLLKQKFREESINFISQDDYYNDMSHISITDRKAVNFDHPNALDFKLLIKHVNYLKNGLAIDKPIYSFEIHNRIDKTKRITPKKVLVLEGILILNNLKINKLCNTTIFIDAPESTRIKRRIKRDSKERGRTKESILFQFKNHITPMHNKFIEPLKHKVNFVFDGTTNFHNDLRKMENLINPLF